MSRRPDAPRVAAARQPIFGRSGEVGAAAGIPSARAAVNRLADIRRERDGAA